jgi:hypothetical protein
MIENNIREYPGDNSTVEEFFDSIRCKLEKAIFSVQFYICVFLLSSECSSVHSFNGSLCARGTLKKMICFLILYIFYL